MRSGKEKGRERDREKGRGRGYHGLPSQTDWVGIGSQCAVSL